MESNICIDGDGGKRIKQNEKERKREQRKRKLKRKEKKAYLVGLQCQESISQSQSRELILNSDIVSPLFTVISPGVFACLAIF